jgi:hypothetical protein
VRGSAAADPLRGTFQDGREQPSNGDLRHTGALMKHRLGTINVNGNPGIVEATVPPGVSVSPAVFGNW